MNAKKKTTRNLSGQTDVDASLSTQPAVERRSAEAQLQALIEKHTPEHSKLISATRRCLRKRLPTAHELIYEYRDFIVISFSPNEHGYEGVLAIRASADCVGLHFNRGKELSDPEKLLKGTGKLVRSIELKGASTLTRPEVSRLIDEAIARNIVPFENAGRGAVTMRSQPAKKRPPSKPSKPSGDNVGARTSKAKKKN